VTLVVSAAVVDAVREHALEQEDGRESVGAIRVEGYQLVSYRRLVNTLRRPYAFAVERQPFGPRELVTHSHPGAGDGTPSPADLLWAACYEQGATGIFSVRLDELRVWKVDRSSYRRMPLAVA
jgi:hypothetical protein